MEKTSFLFIVALFIIGCNHEHYNLRLPEIDATHLNFAPEFCTKEPGLPSPAITKTGRELILLKTKNNRFTWMDATVENGEPFDYKNRLFGKGNQLLANEKDFPHFAKTGIHSEKELKHTKIITGKSVSQITVDGRPWGSSGVGFLAEDETIISVIYSDNQTVKKLKLTHPDIARPLFHFWNLARNFEKYNRDEQTRQVVEFDALVYNGYEIKFNIQGSRGWQESIFNDEILGTGHIQIWRELTDDEQLFLKNNYQNLNPEQLKQLQKKLSWFHTSEMVFFYINRYGFYEGHNEYRPDPVTVALVFGLINLKEAHQACNGNLYKYFNTHFTKNPV